MKHIYGTVSKIWSAGAIGAVVTFKVKNDTGKYSYYRVDFDSNTSTWFCLSQGYSLWIEKRGNKWFAKDKPYGWNPDSGYVSSESIRNEE